MLGVTTREDSHPLELGTMPMYKNGESDNLSNLCSLGLGTHPGLGVLGLITHQTYSHMGFTHSHV
jgi:hypothetical protein